ncbi:hypothetical protein ACP70R_023989 [Stipagrostis hirtigluma subsp. patula]
MARSPSNLGDAYGNHGLHQSVSSFCGSQCVIGAGQQTGLPSEDYLTRATAHCATKKTRRSSTCSQLVCLPDNSGLEFSSPWDGKIGSPLNRNDQWQIGGGERSRDCLRKRRKVSTQLSFLAPGPYGNTEIPVFSRELGPASIDCFTNSTMNTSSGAWLGRAECVNLVLVTMGG